MFLALHRAVAVRMHLLRAGGQALGGPARTGSQQTTLRWLCAVDLAADHVKRQALNNPCFPHRPGSGHTGCGLGCLRPGDS